MLGTALGVLVAFAIMAAFWWWTGPRLSIPAWQVAALPAAAFGGVLGWALGRHRRSLLALAIAGAVFSTAVGEILPLRARLSAARQRRESDPALIQQAIVQRAAQPNEDNAFDDSSRMTHENSIEDDWGILAGLYRERLPRRWREAALMLAISLMASVYSAMVINRNKLSSHHFDRARN